MERRSKTDHGQEDLASYTFPVGNVVGFHALAGEVKVRPVTNNLDLLVKLKSVKADIADKDATTTALSISSIRIDRQMVFLKFQGLNDRTSVEHLAGAKLFAKESELAPLKKEQFWVKDLIGMKAYTTGGQLIGTICDIIPGFTDILEIEPAVSAGGKTILVPFTTPLVPHVDQAAGRVEITELEGLLEPQ
jgi:16S rRNA processing protein RimM